MYKHDNTYMVIAKIESTISDDEIVQNKKVTGDVVSFTMGMLNPGKRDTKTKIISQIDFTTKKIG